jgi:hypothetical protein
MATALGCAPPASSSDAAARTSPSECRRLTQRNSALGTHGVDAAADTSLFRVAASVHRLSPILVAGAPPVWEIRRAEITCGDERIVGRGEPTQMGTSTQRRSGHPKRRREAGAVARPRCRWPRRPAQAHDPLLAPTRSGSGPQCTPTGSAGARPGTPRQPAAPTRWRRRAWRPGSPSGSGPPDGREPGEEGSRDHREHHQLGQAAEHVQRVGRQDQQRLEA